MKPRWISYFEDERYEDALRESVLSGTCTSSQMFALAALVIAASAREKVAA